jgi:hypothetical protein
VQSVVAHPSERRNTDIKSNSKPATNIIYKEIDAPTNAENTKIVSSCQEIIEDIVPEIKISPENAQDVNAKNSDPTQSNITIHVTSVDELKNVIFKHRDTQIISQPTDRQIKSEIQSCFRVPIINNDMIELSCQETHTQSMSLLELPSERNNDKINNSNNFNFGETAIDELTYNNDEANINKGTNEILPSIYAPSNTINTKIKSDSEKKQYINCARD